jgi:hypothetical protein
MKSCCTKPWHAVMAAMLYAVVSPTPAAPIGAASGAIASAQGTPQRQAAENGLADLSDRLMTERPEQPASIFAVDDNRALRGARIGVGFQVNLIDPQALLSGKSIDASTYPANEWRFMVMVDDKPVGLVTVTPMQGRWQMVSAGASGLAKEISDVVAQQSRRDPLARFRFIRSLQGVADLIEVKAADGRLPPRYVPLASARLMSSRSGTAIGTVASASPLDEAQLLPDLRAGIRRGMSIP